jgi:hypothetical protein
MTSDVVAVASKNSFVIPAFTSHMNTYMCWNESVFGGSDRQCRTWANVYVKKKEGWYERKLFEAANFESQMSHSLGQMLTRAMSRDVCANLPYYESGYVPARSC